MSIFHSIFQKIAQELVENRLFFSFLNPCAYLLYLHHASRLFYWLRSFFIKQIQILKNLFIWLLLFQLAQFQFISFAVFVFLVGWQGLFHIICVYLFFICANGTQNTLFYEEKQVSSRKVISVFRDFFQMQIFFAFDFSYNFFQNLESLLLVGQRDVQMLLNSTWA